MAGDDIDMIAKRFAELLPAHKASLHITHNQHLSYYETVEKYLKSQADRGENPYYPDEWLEREDYDRAIATNEIWQVQWYPDTPVGFCITYGSTLPMALRKAMEGDT